MNGYQIASRLREKRRKHNISGGAQALYYELGEVNRIEFDWADTFHCKNITLCDALNITPNTLKKHRQELLDAGLIVFAEGRFKGEATVYSLIDSYISGEKTINLGIRISPLKTKLVPDETDLDVNLGIKNSPLKEQMPVLVSNIDTQVDSKSDTLNKGDFIILNPSSITSSIEGENFFDGADAAKQTQAEEERKKVAAKKESELPSWNVALVQIRSCSVTHSTLLRIKGDEQRMESLFSEFWIEKTDQLKLHVPPWPEIANHFRSWVNIRADKEELLAHRKSQYTSGKQQRNFNNQKTQRNVRTTNHETTDDGFGAL